MDRRQQTANKDRLASPGVVVGAGFGALPREGSVGEPCWPQAAREINCKADGTTAGPERYRADEGGWNDLMMARCWQRVDYISQIMIVHIGACLFHEGSRGRLAGGSSVWAGLTCRRLIYILL